MLRKHLLPIAVALLCSACLTATGPADFTADTDPESWDDGVQPGQNGVELDGVN